MTEEERRRFEAHVLLQSMFQATNEMHYNTAQTFFKFGIAAGRDSMRAELMEQATNLIVATTAINGAKAVEELLAKIGWKI